MKKITLFICLGFLTILLSSTNVSAKNIQNYEIREFINSIEDFQVNWNNVHIGDTESLYGINDEKIGNIYRLYDENNIQQGYVVYTNDIGITEVKFKGEDPAKNIKGKVYYTFLRYYSKQEYYNKVNERIDSYKGSGNVMYNLAMIDNLESINTTYSTSSIISTKLFSNSDVPDLSSNYNSYTGSYSSSQWIDNVPDYVNTYIVDGCTTAASTMIIGYLDNEWNDDLSILDLEWNKDLKEYDDLVYPSTNPTGQDFVDDTMALIGLYNGACSIFDDYIICQGGANAEDTRDGLTNYFYDHNHSEYEFLFRDSSQMDVYSQLIHRGIPSVVLLSDYNGGGGHAVTGIGDYQAFMSPSGIIIYDNLSEPENDGEVWINKDCIDGFVHMSKK